MLNIALTGGVASGKSTVAKYFAALGVPIIDTDVIAKELTAQNSPIYKKIVAQFGNEICLSNGELNRCKLRSIIFKDSAKRLWLEKLLHPCIYKSICERIKNLTSPYCILVVPLLLETKTARFRKIPDRILVVTSPTYKQLARLQKRDNANSAAAKAMLCAQTSDNKRLALADDIIYNDDSLSSLKKQVNALHKKYLALSNN